MQTVSDAIDDAVGNLLMDESDNVLREHRLFSGYGIGIDLVLQTHQPFN